MIQLYDALLFDMDGVLVDVTKSYRKAIQQTAEYFLKREITQLEVEKIKSQVGMNNDWDATYTLINNSLIPYNDVKNLFQKLYWENNGKKGLIADENLFLSKKQLIQLKQAYGKMGIVTGRPRREAQYVIDRFNLKDVFDVLVGKEDVKKEKPFPDPLIYAMKRINAKNAVYIGDSPSDIVAANTAGMPSIFIGEQELGTFRFQNTLEVLDFLL